MLARQERIEHYASLIRSCQDTRQGRQLHERVLGSEFRRNRYLGNLLVEMYGKCGDVESARQAFREVYEPNTISWNIMIAALSDNGYSVAEALGHLYLMLLDGWEPNEVTYLSLVSACGHAGMLKDALSHFKAMTFDHRLRPQAGHFRSILDLLSRAGRLAEAKDLIQNMPFVPETPAWATLLSACGTQGDSRQESSSVAQSVLEMRSGSCGSYVLISNLYSAKKYARQ
ncbi:hypothetical protein SELMODRAFT_137502 [Selaginella moellendorffii]|uniref:Pentacotripeptide-repeat region of PRORP domain-containing protein n=1 Tax=Selaginella moellendorffii TaxID=88036 RepID=D8TDQ0_SELML|nr:hypothetical protein SELMODRAFT_137502 [Selaginella moellendorffii]